MRRHLGSASGNLLFLILIIALVGGYLFVQRGKPSRPAPVTSSILGEAHDAATLYRECQKDIAVCQSRYQGQTMLLSGIVVAKRYDNASPAVALHWDSLERGVLCYFNSSPSQVDSLSTGMDVTLQCKCMGLYPTDPAQNEEGLPLNSRLLFRDCSIVLN